jgi:hypothetical protein
MENTPSSVSIDPIASEEDKILIDNFIALSQSQPDVMKAAIYQFESVLHPRDDWENVEAARVIMDPEELEAFDTIWNIIRNRADAYIVCDETIDKAIRSDDFWEDAHNQRQALKNSGRVDKRREINLGHHMRVIALGHISLALASSAQKNNDPSNIT